MISSHDKWLVVVCAGRWQMASIRATQTAGIRVIALDGDPTAPGLAEADKAIVVDIRDEQAVIDAIGTSGISPMGAVCFTAEAGMAAAAALREHYGLPGAQTAVTQVLTNKSRQRRCWDEAGINGPRWATVKKMKEVDDAVRTTGFPLVVKPTDSAGSRNISFVDNADGLVEAVQHAIDGSREKSAILESWMPGTEYSVESLGDGKTTHVLAVSRKKKIKGTHKTVASELATLPSSDPLVKRISRIAITALDAIGYQTGPAHTELIVSPDGVPRLVETSGRGGGFMVFDGLVPKTSGLDLPVLVARQSIGESVGIKSIDSRPVVLRFIPSRPGIIRNIHGIDHANRLPGVCAQSLVDPAKTYTEPQGDADRLALILAEADTMEDAKAAADRAEECIQFEVV